jgi:hypothetical protein
MAPTDGFDSKASTERKEDVDLFIGVLALAASRRHMFFLLVVSKRIGNLMGANVAQQAMRKCT